MFLANFKHENADKHPELPAVELSVERICADRKENIIDSDRSTTL